MGFSGPKWCIDLCHAPSGPLKPVIFVKNMLYYSASNEALHKSMHHWMHYNKKDMLKHNGFQLAAWCIDLCNAPFARLKPIIFFSKYRCCIVMHPMRHCFMQCLIWWTKIPNIFWKMEFIWHIEARLLLDASFGQVKPMCSKYCVFCSASNDALHKSTPHLMHYSTTTILKHGLHLP